MVRTRVVGAITGQLEELILKFNPGEQLPSEQELAKQLSISKGTLRKALAELTERQLIATLNGVGTIVTEPDSSNKDIKQDIITRSKFTRDLIFLCYDPTFYAPTIASFCTAAAAANYLATIWPLDNDLSRQNRVIYTAIARQPAGILLYANPCVQAKDALKSLSESGIPLVSLMRRTRGMAGDLVCFSNASGLAQLVLHFYQLGCRDFALYGDSSVNPLASQERYDGFVTGMKKCRLRLRPEYICLPDVNTSDYEAFFKLLQGARRPDAICCLNDVCAGNLIQELIRRDINLQNLKISGFDHSPLSKFFPCNFTTIEPPLHLLGETATQLLVRAVETPGLATVTRKLKTQIVEVSQAK